MNRVRAQRGSALLIITILVVVLAGLAGAFLTTTWVEHQATMHTEEEVQCRQAAAAGLDRARRLLFEIRDKDRKATWDEALMRTYHLAQESGYVTDNYTKTETYPNTTGQNIYQYNVATYPPMKGSTETAIPPEMFFGQNFIQGDVVYNAILADDTDEPNLPIPEAPDPLRDVNDQVVVYVTVASPAEPQPGQIRKILGVYRSAVYYIPPEYVPNYAMVVNGNLHLGGSVSVTGLLGSVHANGDLVVEGGTNMVIGTQGSATGTVTLIDSPGTPTEGWKPNAKPVPIPEIDPAAHIDKATFILEKDGNVYDNTVVPRKLITSGTWCGFTFNKVTLGWDKTGADITPPGAIYINGSTKITGGGTAATPWVTTLLVNGSIDMSGNPYIEPALLGVTMMARGDLDITGSPQTFPTIAGLIATHEQVNIGGTAKFEGSVLAEDAEDLYRDVTTISEITSTGVTLTDMTKVMGNFALHFDGNLETFLIAGGSSVAIRSWDRFR